jgi:plasmid maintenance system antidote protein VapI
MEQITQIQMAKELGITPAYMSEVLSSKHPISRPLAEKLEARFPGTTYAEWRRSTPEDIRQAFLREGTGNVRD